MACGGCSEARGIDGTHGCYSARSGVQLKTFSSTCSAVTSSVKNIKKPAF